MYDIQELRVQLATVAQAVADEQIGKQHHASDKLNTSSAVAKLAAMQMIGKWDSKSVSQLADEAHPGLRQTNAFKVRLSQARRVLNKYGPYQVENTGLTLIERWASGEFSEGTTLGAMMRHFKVQTTAFDKMVKAIRNARNPMHSDDLRTLVDIITETLAKRQSEIKVVSNQVLSL